MGGGTSGAMAIVNGRIVRVGHDLGAEDKLKLEFKVVEIAMDHVVFMVREAADQFEIEVQVPVRRFR